MSIERPVNANRAVVTITLVRTRIHAFTHSHPHCDSLLRWWWRRAQNTLIAPVRLAVLVFFPAIETPQDQGRATVNMGASFTRACVQGERCFGPPRDPRSNATSDGNNADTHTFGAQQQRRYDIAEMQRYAMFESGLTKEHQSEDCRQTSSSRAIGHGKSRRRRSRASSSAPESCRQDRMAKNLLWSSRSNSSTSASEESFSEADFANEDDELSVYTSRITSPCASNEMFEQVRTYRYMYRASGLYILMLTGGVYLSTSDSCTNWMK